MPNPIKILVHDFTWIHISIGLFGNFAFLVGSVFFLPGFEDWKTLGVWLFILGAGFMFIGSLGNLLVEVMEPKGKRSSDD